MINLKITSLLTLISFAPTVAFASVIDYSLLRDQSKPANSKVMEATSRSLEDTGLVSLETDGFGTMPLDWVDQIWATPTLSQVIFVKYDLKPKDETVLGKTIKMKTALLIHGQRSSGVYFAAYFTGFDEKTAQEYFNKILHEKSAALNDLKNIFIIPSANAAQVINPCGASGVGAIRGLPSVIKEYKWTCLKSFVKNAFGGILTVVAGTILSVLDGSVWDKVGSNWAFVTSVLSAISKATTSLKELIFLPEKTRTEFVCEALGKGANSASGSLGKNLSGAAIATAASNFVKRVTSELYTSPKYRKIIEENKVKNQAFCAKPTSAHSKTPLPSASSYEGGNGATSGSGKTSTLGK